MMRMFDPQVWAAVPFHFWSAVLFMFGSIVGSFLNVCIHRMPLGQSVVSPPSHCPHCRYSIPWFLNIPLVTWLWLRGKCANCRAPISARYFGVEFLTGLLFLGTWLVHGHRSPWVALALCLFMAGLVVATFIDFEHYIIPDEITIGGMVAGVVASVALPALHFQTDRRVAFIESLIGLGVGFGVIYGVVRLGKLLFGRQKIGLDQPTRVVFTETDLVLPDESVPFADLFYRKSDYIALHAITLELPDRCYRDVDVRLEQTRLQIGDETFDPEEVSHLEAVTQELVLPREAMGFGDVKFMGAIGAFLGWQSIIFTLTVASLLGAFVGVGLIVLRGQDRAKPIPFGPYLAGAAALWVLGGFRWLPALWHLPQPQ